MPSINLWMLLQSSWIISVASTTSSSSHATACLFKVNGYSKFESHLYISLLVSRSAINKTNWPGLKEKKKIKYLSSDILAFYWLKQWIWFNLLNLRFWKLILKILSLAINSLDVVYFWDLFIKAHDCLYHPLW